MDPIGIVAGVGVAVLFVGCVGAFIRTCKKPVLKTSRSDPDFTNILQESIP